MCIEPSAARCWLRCALSAAPCLDASSGRGLRAAGCTAQGILGGPAEFRRRFEGPILAGREPGASPEVSFVLYTAAMCCCYALLPFAAACVACMHLQGAAVYAVAVPVGSAGPAVVKLGLAEAWPG